MLPYYSPQFAPGFGPNNIYNNMRGPLSGINNHFNYPMNALFLQDLDNNNPC